MKWLRSARSSVGSCIIGCRDQGVSPLLLQLTAPFERLEVLDITSPDQSSDPAEFGTTASADLSQNVRPGSPSRMPQIAGSMARGRR
jgi:hypothetical protein